MNLQQIVQAIKGLYPSALRVSDYTISTDTNGEATIATWNAALGTQPTADQLTTELTTIQLVQAQIAQIAIITAASTSAQTSGFTSSALGSSYTYPSGVLDQANLTAVVTASMIAPTGTTFLFWCTSSAGVESFVSHTTAQIHQVGLDGMSSIMAAKQKQATLTAQINAATTIAAVQAITGRG